MVAVAKKGKVWACRVCALTPHERAYIDGKLRDKRSPRFIAGKVRDVTRKDVAQHAVCCPNTKIKEPVEEDHANEDQDQAHG